MDTAATSMVNLPAFSGATLSSILLANGVMLFTLFVLAGPALISGQDTIGRPLGLTLLRRVLMIVVLLGATAFLAAQVVLLSRFWPYLLDPGTVAVERVTATAAEPPGDPVVFWIATQNHRFGVLREIARQVSPGDLVEVRFRAIDDTLYEIRVLERGVGS